MFGEWKVLDMPFVVGRSKKTLFRFLRIECGGKLINGGRSQ